MRRHLAGLLERDTSQGTRYTRESFVVGDSESLPLFIPSYTWFAMPSYLPLGFGPAGLKRGEMTSFASTQPGWLAIHHKKWSGRSLFTVSHYHKKKV